VDSVNSIDPVDSAEENNVPQKNPIEFEVSSIKTRVEDSIEEVSEDSNKSSASNIFGLSDNVERGILVLDQEKINQFKEFCLNYK